MFQKRAVATPTHPAPILSGRLKKKSRKIQFGFQYIIKKKKERPVSKFGKTPLFATSINRLFLLLFGLWTLILPSFFRMSERHIITTMNNTRFRVLLRKYILAKNVSDCRRRRRHCGKTAKRVTTNGFAKRREILKTLKKRK